MPRFTLPAVLFACLVLIVTGLQWVRSTDGSPSKNSPRSGQLQSLTAGTAMPYEALPEFTLLGPDNTEVTRADLEGRWHFVYMGYTQCPDICPKAMGILREISGQLRAQEVGYWFISADPSQDTPEKVAQYAKGFSAQFEGYTGEYEHLAHLGKAFHLFLSNEEHPEQAPIAHSNALMLVNPHAELVALFMGPSDPKAIVTDFKYLKRKFRKRPAAS